MAETALEIKIIDALKTVMDPDLHKNIVSLGFVKNIKIENGGKVRFDVELTTPACPVKEQLRNECRTKVLAIEGVKDVEVNMTASVRPMQHAQPVLTGVKNTIAVASGKGGVGKSTVATNLALALCQSGAKVGIMDADIYGPSIPQMLGLPITPPRSSENKIYPHTAHGMKVISAAFLAKEGQPLMLRGPMLGGIIQQFLTQVEWGELDYLVIDLPPGTGDVQLTLTQRAPLSGGVIVTTPQQVSLIDAEKGVRMFQQVKVPILGIVENMSYFIPPDDTSRKYYIFRRDGGKQMAEKFNVPLLGQIPIMGEVCEGGDSGIPIVMSHPGSPVSKAYMDLAGRVAAQISIHQAREDKPETTFDLAWKS